MERLRQIAGRAAGLAALLAAGCASPAVMTESVSHAVKSATTWAAPAAPATELVCVWQRRLTSLPDPARDGTLSPGLAGQMFLITAGSSPADVSGDVTVAVYDETPRPAGGTAHTPEVWHFTADVVRQMGTNDERFGRSYVLFLPWRPEWRDVTTVRVLTRYDAPGAPSLHAGEVRLALDLSSPDAPVWTETAPGANPSPPGYDSRSVPDGARVVQQALAASVAGAGAGSGVRPAAATVPAPATKPAAAPRPVEQW